MTSKQLKAIAHLAPKSDEEAIERAHDAITTQTMMEEAVAFRDRKVADAKLEIESKYGLDKLITDCDLKLAQDLALLEMWAERNRARFGEKKSTTLAGIRVGWKSIGWRTALLSKVTWSKACDFLDVLIKRGDAPDATEMAKQIGAMAARFVRVKLEPNKDAMIAAREDAAACEVLISAGVMIETEDQFFIRREGDGQAESTLKAA